MPRSSGRARRPATYRAEFVVRLKPGVSSERLAIAYGAKHVYAYPDLDNVNLWQAGPGTNPVNFPKRLLRDARVLDAYPVYQPGVVKHSLPNDPLLPVQWHLYNVGQTNGATNGGVVESNVEAAWDTGMTGKGALISVVDDGIEYTHPDLNDHIVQSASYDFLSGDDDPMPTATARRARHVGGRGGGGRGEQRDRRVRGGPGRPARGVAADRRGPSPTPSSPTRSGGIRPRGRPTASAGSMPPRSTFTTTAGGSSAPGSRGPSFSRPPRP